MKNIQKGFRNFAHRERLYKQLDDFTNHPAAWVSGPPGSGKTTLIRGFLEARELPGIWYQLDDEDNDSGSFFYNLAEAITHECQASGYGLETASSYIQLSNSYLIEPSTVSKRIFKQLALEFPVGTVLVLDNYHKLDPTSQVHAVLLSGLDELIDKLPVICISRNEPPSAWSRFRVQRKINFLDWEALQFQQKEVYQLAEVYPNSDKFDHAMLDNIHRQCKGWAAGIILALEGIGRHGLETDTARRSTLHAVSDYFTEELYNSLDVDSKKVLLIVSILPRIYLSIAERLLSSSVLVQVLDNLNSRNIFTEKIWEPEIEYSLHPLFLEFLRSRAIKDFTHENWLELHKRAGLLLEKHGKPEESVEVLLVAELFTDAAPLILKLAPEIVSQGRYRRLESWLDRLNEIPPEILYWSMYWRGVTASFHSVEESRISFESAYQGFRKHGDLTGQLAAWSGVVETLFALWGKFSEADFWIEHLMDMLGDGLTYPDDATEENICATLLAVLLFRQPSHPQIGPLAIQVENLIQRSKDSTRRFKMGHGLLHYLLFMGELPRATMVIKELSDIDTAPDLPPLVKNAWHTTKAAFYWQIFESDFCLAEVKNGLDNARETGMLVWNSRLHAQAVYLYLTTDRVDEAAHHLESMRVYLPTMLQTDRSLFHFLSGWQHLLKNEYPSALEQAKRAKELACDTPWPDSSTRLLFAKILWEVNSKEQAYDELKEALLIAKSIGSAELMVVSYFIQADWFLQENDIESAEPVLRKAFVTVRERELFNGSLWGNASLSKLCSAALAAGIETELVHKLIRKRGLIPTESSYPTLQWPWPVKVNCLDGFSVQVDNSPLQFGRKAQRRPLDLLKYLIAMGGAEVPEGRIAETLWPDTDADAAFQAYTTTLYRLRKLPGFSKALVRKEQTLTLDPRQCWVDALEFSKLTSRLMTLSTDSLSDVETMKRATTAIEIYKTGFLVQEIDASWAIRTRERLRSAYIQTVCSVAGYWQHQGNLELAISGYQDALLRDDLAEGFYTGLMSCYLEQARYADGLDVYRRCEDVLSSELSIQPSAKTKALKDRLSAH